MALTDSDYEELLGLGTAKDAAIVGGAYDGADVLKSRLDWTPMIQPANDEVVPSKPGLDARARDLVRNDAYVSGGATLHRDHIVGHQYLLNAKPQTSVLFGREDETWEAEFQAEVETKFHLWAESPNCWPDASRINTLTGLVRLAVGSFVVNGEVLASAEWGPDDGRPFRSSMLMLDADRLCNPNFNEFAPNIVGGVERDRKGAPIAYHILDRHPTDWRMRGLRTWRRVMARKPNWGRPQILHIFEQLRPDQARGIGAMVSALTEMRMTREFRKVELQRAVVAATYAATVESDLPPGDVYAAMGAGEGNPSLDWMEGFMSNVQEYNDAAKNLRIDGVKIPTMAPGTHLKIQSPSASAPLGADFETSLLRHIAASLGVSYEQLARDYSNTNYSSARAAMGETMLHMQARKKQCADKTASFVYRLWLEEAINRGEIEAAKGSRMPSFYAGMNSEAYCAADWLGAGRSQMDPLKETQAAALRLRTGISTLEIENALLNGSDWRSVMRQNAREKKMAELLGLPSVYTSEPTDAENAATGSPREPEE